MARFLLFLLVLTCASTGSVHSAVTPCQKNIPFPTTDVASLKSLLKLKLTDIEKINGKKLSVKQKLQIRVSRLASSLIPGFEEGIPTANQAKQGRKSFIYGSAAIFLLVIGMFVPIMGLLSLPFGIAALVLGIKSIKGNGNTEALIGIITGSVVSFFWLIGIIAIIVLISTGGFWG